MNSNNKKLNSVSQDINNLFDFYKKGQKDSNYYIVSKKNYFIAKLAQNSH